MKKCTLAFRIWTVVVVVGGMGIAMGPGRVCAADLEQGAVAGVAERRMDPGTERGGEKRLLRVAIGPFQAPVGREDLREAARLLPELLTVDLSKDPGLVLVERQAVDGLWSELGLAGSGLTSRDAALRMGRTLSCDWVLSGSLVEEAGKTFLWTRLTDARVGEVVDLQSAPFNPGVTTNVAARMASFVAQAGRTGPRANWVGLGPFVDLTPDVTTRESWGLRLQTLLEKACLDRGIGVAELGAIGPLFEERRLQSAGAMAKGESLPLRPAFWFVDGGGGWVETEGLGLVAVGVRIQRAGVPARLLWFTNAPTPEFERALVDEVFAVVGGPARPVRSAGHRDDPELEILTARGREMAERRSPFPARPPAGPAGGWMTQWDQYRQMEAQNRRNQENRRALMANYERMWLKDPGNLEAKYMLAMCWVGEQDPARQERGVALLKEVAGAGGDSRWPDAARRFLSPAILDRARGGGSGSVKRPTDWHSVNMAYREKPDDPEIQCDFGAALLATPRPHDQLRGHELLAKVAAGPDATQAARARRLLASAGPAPKVEPVVTPANAPAAGLGKDREVVETVDEKARREFLQANFDRFVPLKFRATNPGSGLGTLAAVQMVGARTNLLRHAGRSYVGFRFVVPQNVGGDLEWMFLFAKNEAEQAFGEDDFKWYIVPRRGPMKGFSGFSRLDLERFPKLQQRFPHTRKVITQSLDESRFEPGREYAIWLGFPDEHVPDLAVSLTLGSLMGRQVYGRVPLE